MPVSLDDKMEKAIGFFSQAAEETHKESRQQLFEHLRAMAAGVQEGRRVLDYLQTQIDEIHHELGLR